MRVRLALGILCAAIASAPAAGQTRRPAARPAQPPLVKEAPQMVCPNPLGTGRTTKLAFCDVLVGREPSTGIVITIPPHRGEATLTFDLHNRHTFSEEEQKDKLAAFARYTASVGALTADNTLISRAVVQNEYRGPADFFDRITGGAGPSGLKAVAPIGTESIRLTIPESENSISILGEKLSVDRASGVAQVTTQGRAIAIISNVMIEYRKPPPARAPARRPATRPPG